jgi:hypothetical protein
MTYKRALEADARLAAKNALKIRAALRQTFDPKRVYEQYLLTQPNQSDSAAQNNARARAWVMLNVRVNMEALKEVMLRVWAEGYVTGQAFADEQLRIARELNKADDTMAEIDWANWQPGDRAAALLLRPPKAFQQLLESQGITFKEFSDTTVRDIGNAIGEAIELGLPAERAAKRLMTHVANPARALSIAITEQNRAISYATINRYKEAELEKMEWEVSSPCDKCAQNANQVVIIGQPFKSGNTQPPAHPHCRCVLLPVLPNFEEIAATPTGTTLTPMPADVPVARATRVLDDLPKRTYTKAKNDADFYLADVEGTEDRLKAMIPTKQRPDGTIIPDWNAASGGKGPENIQLKNLMREQGFLDLPRVVDADEFGKIVDQGATPIYRGMGAPTKKQASEYVERLVSNDDPFIGRGFFGDGTYFASDRGIAERFAASDASGDITFKFGEIVDAVIDPQAKVMDIEDLWRLRNEYTENMPYHGELAQAYEDDIGLFATSMGVDVIENKNPMIGYTDDGQRKYAPGSYFTVLNRSALIVKGKP